MKIAGTYLDKSVNHPPQTVVKLSFLDALSPFISKQLYLKGQPIFSLSFGGV